MWYVYILKLKYGNLYVGSTGDLKRRMIEHQQGKSVYTRNLLPLALVAYIAVKSESGARTLEKYLKTSSGKSILRRKILSNEV